MDRFGLLTLLLLGWGSLQLAAESEERFLVLSDIHFNPLSDQSLKESLSTADVQRWESILAQAPSQIPSAYGDDTNWPLLQSVLRRARTLPEKPKFVLITGDLLAHHLREHFESSDSPSSNFPAFAQKTVQFLGREFRADFPDIPVITALGNNDGDCRNVDYSIEPGGEFLKNTLPAIAEAAGVHRADLEDSWSSLGSYDIAHPTLKNNRLIVLNTTFFSWRYQNSCGESADDPGARLLSWLRNRLSAARAHDQKVWLVYHIPPGIDGYASTHQRAPNSERVVTMWNPRYQAEFERILQEYGERVQNQFAGHTHFDEFRLLGPPGAYSGFVLLNPGVSPNVRQNPAIREVRYKSDGTLTDFDTWYLPLLRGAGEWKLGYRFRREWRFKAVNLSTLSKLYREMSDSSKIRTEWQEIYSVWSLDKKGMTKRDYAATSCATGNTHPEDFRRCFCDSIPDAAFCKN